jgi:hypothetical protein
MLGFFPLRWCLMNFYCLDWPETVTYLGFPCSLGWQVHTTTPASTVIPNHHLERIYSEIQTFAAMQFQRCMGAHSWHGPGKELCSRRHLCWVPLSLLQPLCSSHPELQLSIKIVVPLPPYLRVPWPLLGFHNELMWHCSDQIQEFHPKFLQVSEQLRKEQ